MIKNLLTTSVFFVALILNAQKVDLDRFNFSFEYRDLPHNPLDSTFKTFSVMADVTGDVARSMSSDVIESAVILQGFGRSFSNGDVRIRLSVEDLFIDKNQVVENTSETKNKDGSVTKNYSYYVSLDYTIGGTFTVTDRNGVKLLSARDLFSSKRFNWASATYKTRSEASSYYYNNKSAIVNKLVRDRMEEAIALVNKTINYEFGFPVTKTSAFLWLSDSKKHPETEEMNTRWSVLKPALQNVSGNEFDEETVSKIKVMIEYFDGLKTKYTEDEKSHRKIRYSSWYNNAVLYMLLDMPDKAVTEAQGLIANDYDAKDGDALIKDAEALMELFNKNKTHSRHFRI